MFDTLKTLLGWPWFPRRKPDPLPEKETDLAYGPDPLQTLDVYRPPNTLPGDQLPAIVMVHGGGFVDGDKANPGVADIKAAYYCPRGRIVVSINYRLDVPPHMQAQDVAAAVAFAGRLPGAGLITLMAHSAGGTDAALALGLCNVDNVVLLDPATLDAVATMDHPHDAVFDPLGATREEWERNSPIAQLSGAIPPCLIVTSGDRGKAFARQAQDYANKALHLGCPSATVLAYPDLSHEDCNKLVGTPCALTDAIDKFLSAQS